MIKKEAEKILKYKDLIIEIEGDTKERELLKCVVAAMYS